MCLPRHVEKTDKIFRLQRKYLRVTENIQVTETKFKSQKKTFDPRNVWKYWDGKSWITASANDIMLTCSGK